MHDYDPAARDVRSSFGCLVFIIGGGVMILWTVASCRTPWQDRPKPPEPPAISIPDPDAEAVRRARAKLGLTSDGQPLSPPAQPPAQAKP